MDGDFIEVCKALFGWSWDIMTAVKVPGTDTNAASFLFAIFFVWFTMRWVVPWMYGLNASKNDSGDDSSSHSRGRDVCASLPPHDD